MEILLLALWLVIAIVAGVLAQRKQRSVVQSSMVGIFPLTILILLALETKPEETPGAYAASRRWARRDYLDLVIFAATVAVAVSAGVLFWG